MHRNRVAAMLAIAAVAGALVTCGMCVGRHQATGRRPGQRPGGRAGRPIRIACGRQVWALRAASVPLADDGRDHVHGQIPSPRLKLPSVRLASLARITPAAYPGLPPDLCKQVAGSVPGHELSNPATAPTSPGCGSV
jgi:hypothetical protein